MDERNWTKEQTDAITVTSSDLLVSAAAGSGKTAVLTERIIRKILDKDNPLDISRILVVTFTRAAANELKERISAALTRAIADNPADKRLARQYVLLGKAHISTIDGFCLETVRNNFEKLAISADVRVADEAQNDLLMKQVADYVIDNYYSGADGYDDIDGFAEFADNFITLREDSALSDILIDTYNSVSSFPRGTEFLLDFADEYKKALNDGFFSTVWGKSAVSEAKRKLRYFKKTVSDGCDYLASVDIFKARYLPSFNYLYDYTSTLLRLFDAEDLDGIEKHFKEYAPIKLGSVKSENKTEETDFYDSKRKDLSEYIKKLRAEVSYYHGDGYEKAAQMCHTYTNNIYRFVKKFEERLIFEKRKRNILYHNDIERLTLKLLTDENGEPTPDAVAVAADYDEIYIDEYQDVNKIQDMIFSAIAKNTGRFMVGDIKQSIYGFRGAEPSLFAGYRRDPDIDKIYLKKNFRCSSSVIDFVNSVCGKLFQTVGTTVPYNSSDELVLGRKDSPADDTELHIVECDGNTGDMNIAEASFVADKISDMIKHGTSRGDIAILLRKTENLGQIYEDELSKRGITCINNAKKDLFVNPEILLVMDILNVIDNPTRDVCLAGALKSPVYNFSLSELIGIRKYSAAGSLYDALVVFTEENDFPKGKYFLSKLSLYRSMINQPVDKLIWFILCDTDMFAVAAGNSDCVSANKGNLLHFYECARKFESGSFKGLYNFIRYINDIIENNGRIDSASSENSEAVKIMTIHHSKGLEFPVVFLCGTSSGISENYKRKSVPIDRESGITMKLPDSGGFASVNTLFRECAFKKTLECSVDEEIRVLYVALTRAVNKLIVTSSVKNADKYLKNISKEAELYSGCPETYFSHSDFMSWILISSGGKYLPQITAASPVTQKREINGGTENTDGADAVGTEDEAKIEEYRREYEKRFGFRYPNSVVCDIPAKFSVSQLYPAILDEFDDSEKTYESTPEMKAPSFITGEMTGAAEKGTATHLFMQFCDLSLLNENGVENEISRLTENQFIDRRTAGLINRHAVSRFISSKLFADMLNAGFMKRELRFNIRLPASAFTENPEKKDIFSDEKILVQGIIDCLFTDADGNLVLLDYKTDRAPYEYRNDTDKFGELLIERHKRQLSYYFKAVSEIMRRKPDRVIIYSFDCGRGFEITADNLMAL